MEILHMPLLRKIISSMSFPHWKQRISIITLVACLCLGGRDVVITLICFCSTCGRYTFTIKLSDIYFKTRSFDEVLFLTHTIPQINIFGVLFPPNLPCLQIWKEDQNIAKQNYFTQQLTRHNNLRKSHFPSHCC